jgi:D-glycerate 3-kinase
VVLRKQVEIVDMMLGDFIVKHKLSLAFVATARQWYIPLAENLKLHHQGASKTYYVGMNGCQGSGKSTLAQFIKGYLQNLYQLNVVVLSLDDFYLSHTQRLAMAVKIHPLFATRGVPGTHNMALAKQTLVDLAARDKRIAVPRFNKASDNPHPQQAWPIIDSPVDIVIFEGWCWGVCAQSKEQLRKPVNELEKNRDEIAVWRNYVNRKLASDYQPLYPLMDYWLMLKAPSFEATYAWRAEQEQKLHLVNRKTKDTAQKDTRGLMNAQQIHQFIQYYQRLTEHALLELPASCDQVFALNAQREICLPQQESKHD